MSGSSRRNRPRVLVFGEDLNDTRSLIELAMALCPAACIIFKARRRPLVLVKGREPAKQKKNAADIARVVSAEVRLGHHVVGVVAHQDCDAVEPAHLALSQAIENRLSGALTGVDCIAATPAWEMEAWLYLWPEAIAAVNGKWKRPGRAGMRVGLIREAKETLRRDLRPTGKVSTRDYTESDSPKVTRKVRELGLIDSPVAVSGSFTTFASSLRSKAWCKSTS